LGEWRRTKYTAEVTPLLEGETITLFGWVAGIRRHGGIIFITVYDKEGSIQLTVKQDLAPQDLVNALDNVSDHSSIGIRGIVKKMDKAPNGVEIQPIEMKVLAIAKKSPPFQLQGTKIPRIDKLLDIRALALRRPEARAIIKVRNSLRVGDGTLAFVNSWKYFQLITCDTIFRELRRMTNQM